MKKFLTGKTPIIIVGILFVIFNVIYWPIVGPRVSEIRTAGWVAYGFACGSFLFPAVASLLRARAQTTSSARMPLFVSAIIYWVVAMITNLIVMLINRDEYTAVLILNIVYILLFAIAALVSYRFFNRISTNTEVRENRMEAWKMIAIDVTSLRNFTEDEELVKAINALRDNINNSTSASNEATKGVEEELKEQIVAIKSMLRSGTEKETVLKALKVAEGLLKTRNQTLMAARRN